MGYYQAAIISYDYVLETNFDTEYIEKSLYHKGECLYKLEDFESAQSIFEDVLRQYPASHLAEQARKKLKDINR